MLSSSLMGCASNTPPEGPEMFEQKVYSSDKDMIKNGYTLISEKDKTKTFERMSLNGGKVSVITNDKDSSTIDKISDNYADYQTCLTSFNEDNKKMQETFEKSNEFKKYDDNNTSFSYGASRFKFRSEPCVETVNAQTQVKSYQYKIHVEGLTHKEKSEVLSNIGQGLMFVVMLPVMVVAAIIIIPIGLISLLVYCTFARC